MDNIRKGLVIAGMGAIGWVGTLLIVKAARPKRPMGTYEKIGKGMDERLSESKAALDKAAAQVQSVFEQIKNRKWGISLAHSTSNNHERCRRSRSE
jgi:hypothetical protein